MSTFKGIIYIVEDDQSFRKSIERLIRTAGFEVKTFDSADSFMADAPVRRPACLLLDVRLPGINGLQLQQKLIEQGRSLPIIFMTGHGDIPMSVEAMKKGAIDFLPKPFKAKDLLAAVNAALDRDRLGVTKENERQKVDSLIQKLTPRELEIMRWVITGMLNKQIAYDLNISEKTVKVHRARVMQKTEVTSVAELVRLAQLAGIDPIK